MQTLTRRTKNNPVLIGEPGVGKTAIVEGLAQKISRGDIPTTLQGKRLVTLEATKLRFLKYSKILLMKGIFLVLLFVLQIPT